MQECEVCCEEYKVGVDCVYCNYGTCVQCAQTYLLSTQSDPHCMSCKKPWTREFLASKFAKKFITHDLKNHREDVIHDRERSMLPATQEYAERERSKRNMEKELEVLQERIQIVEAEFYEAYPMLQRFEAEMKRIIDEARAALEPCTLSREAIRSRLENRMKDPRLTQLKKEYAEVNKDAPEYRKIQAKLESVKRSLKFDIDELRRRIKNVHQGEVPVEEAGPSKPKQTFVRACPVNDCRGFLSSAWKCGMCGVNVCAKCHEVKDKGKLLEHECKKENVETAKLLASETRPCPSCAAVISKVSGCDQMWCTQCHTAFSWKTGSIVKSGVIHNPHYFEYMMKNGKDVPRNPGDVPCGGLPNYYTLAYNKEKALQDAVTKIYQGLGEAIDLRDKYVENRMNDNIDIRARFLLGDFNEARFKQLLQMRAKANDKVQAIHQVLETFVTVGSGLVHELAKPSVMTYEVGKPILDQLEELRVYIMDSLNKVSGIYDCKIPIITEAWKIIPVGQRKVATKK
jgi:hypothetical protein